MSPLALLLTTLDGVTSSSVGDLVRGEYDALQGEHGGQWVPQRGHRAARSQENSAPPTH